MCIYIIYKHIYARCMSFLEFAGSLFRNNIFRVLSCVRIFVFVGLGQTKANINNEKINLYCCQRC